jgi:hypothetical protein
MANPSYALSPDSDDILSPPGGNTWTIVGGTTEFSVLADEDDLTYLKGTKATLPVHTYGLSSINAPSGAAVSGVEVTLRAQRVTGGTPNITVRLILPNGTQGNNKSWALGSGGIKDHTFTFTTSRPGGGTWTTADFNGMQVRLSYGGATAPVDLRIYRYRVVVYLDPATMPTPTIVSASHTDVTSSSVRLDATVNPNGFTAQYPLLWTFEYDVPATPILPDPESPANGSAEVNLNTVVSGLSPGGVYGFRLRMHKGDLVYIYGVTQNYSTLASDAPLLML